MYSVLIVNSVEQQGGRQWCPSRYIRTVMRVVCRERAQIPSTPDGDRKVRADQQRAKTPSMSKSGRVTKRDGWESREGELAATADLSRRR